MSEVSAIDAAWLRMDRPTNLAINTSVLWFALPLDWEAVGELLRERLVNRVPRFSQRAVEPRISIGMPRWEDHPALTCGDTCVVTGCTPPVTRPLSRRSWRRCSPLHSFATVAAWRITNQSAFV